jgi:Ser-tRNA(Ala) deacylase AlaX
MGVVELLFLEDSYLRGCDAEVQSVEEGRYVAIDRTIFPEAEGGREAAQELRRRPIPTPRG